MSLRQLFALCLLLVASSWALAQQALSVPKLTQYVTDQAGIFDSAQRQALESKLEALDARTGSQVVVLTVPTLGNEVLEDYAIRVAESNQVGRKKLSDGVLVLVVPNDRKVRIEVGYGLEGAIPDATAIRVIQEYMAPRFRAGDYAGGINDAVDALDKLIVGEQLPAPVADNRPASGSGGGNWLFPLIAAIIAAQVLRGLFGFLPTGVRALFTGVASGGVAWVLSTVLLVSGIGAFIGFIIGLMGSGGGGRYARHHDWGGLGGGPWIGGGGSGGGWGGGSSGGGGGFGGGGFSGGGGSFGGGGASGSW